MKWLKLNGMVDNKILMKPYSLNSELHLVWKWNQLGHGHWAWAPKTHPRPAMILSLLVPPRSHIALYKSLGPWANMFRMPKKAEAGSPQIGHQTSSVVLSPSHMHPPLGSAPGSKEELSEEGTKHPIHHKSGYPPASLGASQCIGRFY